MSRYRVVGIGEVLWDVFRTHKKLGGAPTNFAYISNLLGDEGVVASRVGADSLGAELLDQLAHLGLRATYVQDDASHPTGTVKVHVSDQGQARFEITKWVAWDYLEWNSELKELAAEADAVCFGTLAQREPESRATIQKFVRATRKRALRVFDVNLRQSFYSGEVLSEGARIADILKISLDELPQVLSVLKAPQLEELSAARWILRHFPVKMVCITRGEAGSLLATPDSHHEHRGHKCQMVDSVGAGDAFTATLVHHYLRGSDLPRMNDAANRVGSWVASSRGATPNPNPEVLQMARAAG